VAGTRKAPTVQNSTTLAQVDAAARVVLLRSQGVLDAMVQSLSTASIHADVVLIIRSAADPKSKREKDTERERTYKVQVATTSDRSRSDVFGSVIASVGTKMVDTTRFTPRSGNVPSTMKKSKSLQIVDPNTTFTSPRHAPHVRPQPP
jgi:hypothetical protein